MKKVKNMVKKITALLIVAAMMIGSCMSVMAEGEQGSENPTTPTGQLVNASTTGQITVMGLNEGDAVYLIPMISIDYNAGNNTVSYSFANDTMEEMAKVAGIVANEKYSTSIERYKSLGNTEDAGEQALFKAFVTAIQNRQSEFRNAAGTRRESVSGGSTSVVFSNVKMGQYYISIGSKSGRIYQPITSELIPVIKEDPVTNEKAYYLDNDVTNVTNVKYQEPTVVKSIKTEDKVVSIGSEVEYTVTISVPKYPDNFKNITMKVTDTLGAGLKFKGGSLEIKSNSDKILEEGVHYTVGEYADKQEMVVVFNYEAVQGYTELTLKYKAIVTNEIAVGGITNSDPNNVNTVKYTYTVDTDGTTNEKTDTESTTTYGLRITKFDAGTESRVLPGVEFELYKGEEKVRFYTKNVLSTFLGDSGADIYDTVVYYVTQDNNEKVTTKLVTDDKGVIAIIGLDEGTYTLKETKALPGYKPIDDRTFTVTELTPAPKKEGIYLMKVENRKDSYELPSTGGDGIWFFIGGGIVLMGAAVVMLVAAKKKGKRNVA